MRRVFVSKKNNASAKYTQLQFGGIVVGHNSYNSRYFCSPMLVTESVVYTVIGYGTIARCRRMLPFRKCPLLLSHVLDPANGTKRTKFHATPGEYARFHTEHPKRTALTNMYRSMSP